jgi:hypothetical protein
MQLTLVPNTDGTIVADALRDAYPADCKGGCLAIAAT